MQTNQTTPNDTQKQCFSYIRFSSRQQAKGDSLRRQMEIAPKVASQKGWLLREDLCAKNLGFSAYKGSNLDTINGIIKAAQQGKIPHGTVMIIEALDRLTRLSLDDAHQLLRSVLLSGIEIYTDNAQRHHTKADLNNPMLLMLTVAELHANFKKSDDLADRCGKAWRQKKARAADGVIMGKMVPGWLEADTKTNTITTNDKAETVKRIFASYANGKGIRTIMRELNRDGILPLGKGNQNKEKAWSSTHIRRVLGYRSVIGEYQPCRNQTENGTTKRVEDGVPISDYYPTVIEKPLFFKVQDMLSKTKIDPKTGKRFNRRPSGPKRNVTNLFTGMVKCAVCGGSMVIKQGGLSHGKYAYTSLICYNATRGNGCKYHTIQYGQVERAVLTLIFYKVVPALTETNDKQEKLMTLKGELEHAKKQLAKWTAIVNEESVSPATAVRQLNLYEMRQTVLNRQIEALEATLDDNPLMAWRQVSNTPDNRLRLQTILADEIESLTIDAANRTAKLLMKSPRLEFDISWPQSVGTNATRLNPAKYGFTCEGVGKMFYQDIWKNAQSIPFAEIENGEVLLDSTKYLSHVDSEMGTASLVAQL